MKQVLTICILGASLLTGHSPLRAQALFQKATKTVYGLYGRHFSTHYIVDSGTTNLVARKMNISCEGGLLLDFPVYKKWAVRTGIFGHLHFLTEPLGYATTGNYPSDVRGLYTESNKNKYSRGGEYAERTSISLPLKVLFSFAKGNTYEWNIAAGPVISFYTPARDEEVGFYYSFSNYSPSPSDIYQFHIERRFFKKELDNFLQLSVPQLEWQAETEVVRKFKRKGALVGGLKASLGTTRLERADFVTWPQYPQYRSKGHYSLNRSYIGVYLGYRFGTNKKL